MNAIVVIELIVFIILFILALPSIALIISNLRVYFWEPVQMTDSRETEEQFTMRRAMEVPRTGKICLRTRCMARQTTQR